VPELLVVFRQRGGGSAVHACEVDALRLVTSMPGCWRSLRLFSRRGDLWPGSSPISSLTLATVALGTIATLVSYAALESIFKVVH